MSSDALPLQSIVDNLHTAIILVADKLTIRCMNPAAEMLFHFSANRAAGRHINHLIVNDHELYDRLERALISHHPFRVYEASLSIHTGAQIDVDYAVSPVEQPDREACLLLEFTPLSHQQRHAHEESLLQQQEASKSLLRGLAHEIKNPLGGLRGAAQLLERELDEKNRRFTRIIIDEADRLKNLVDRMVGPREIPRKQPVNIHKLIEHVRELVAAECEENATGKPIRLRTDYDPSIPDIEADESMLIQAILNITRNAVSAIDPAQAGDGEIVFRTRARRNCPIGNQNHPLAASLEIIDNGVGVSEALQETIFLPMITGRADGTGLGLSIAQSLVQQHGGLIEFTSEPGHTVFTLLLPIQTENGDKHD